MADLPLLQEPLTLAEVRLNLRVDTAVDDNVITPLITAAREYVEDVTGMVLTTERMVTETASALGLWIELSSWPVSQVTEVRHPVAGVLIALAAGAWQVSYARRPVRLLPAQIGWGIAPSYGPTGLPVEIDVIAGYADPTKVPARAKQAMHLLIAHWYSNRAAVESGAHAAAIEVPLGVAELVRTLRLVRV